MSILPDTVRDLLYQLRGDGDSTRWTIGDMTAELTDELHGNFTKEGKRITRQRVRQEIADITGVQPSTVRQYETVSRFYVPKLRAEFPALTYTHFREAAKLVTETKAIGLLRLAVESADEFGGMPMPPRVMAEKVKSMLGKQDITPPSQRLTNAVNIINNVMTDPAVPLSRDEAEMLARITEELDALSLSLEHRAKTTIDLEPPHVGARTSARS